MIWVAILFHLVNWYQQFKGNLCSSGIWGGIEWMFGYWHFGTTCQTHLQWSSLTPKDGLISCPDTSVTNYQSTLPKIPEECRSYSFCSGSLKLCSLNEPIDKLCGTEEWRVQRCSVVFLGVLQLWWVVVHSPSVSSSPRLLYSCQTACHCKWRHYTVW